MDSVPQTLPALAYSQVIQERAAQTGFDWPSNDGVLQNVEEEIQKFREALTPEQKQKELGEIFLALVNLGRKAQFDVESLLREANTRFYSRFMAMERLSRDRGYSFVTLPLEEKNSLGRSQNDPDNKCRDLGAPNEGKHAGQNRNW